jgi:hypothetical protein
MPVKGQPKRLLASVVISRWALSPSICVEVKPSNSWFSIRCSSWVQAAPNVAWGAKC